MPNIVTSDGEVPDTVTPGGNVPDTLTPGGEVPDTVKSGGNVPNIVTSDGEVPDTVKPGGNVPDIVTSDGEVPDKETPGGEVPGEVKPDGEVLDLAIASEVGDINKVATTQGAENVANTEGQCSSMIAPSGGEAQMIADAEEVECSKDMDCVRDDVHIPSNNFSDKTQNVSKVGPQLASIVDVAVIVDDKLESTCDALDTSEARDVSEMASSHTSFSTLTTTNASEGSVTLDSLSIESVSSMEQSPQTISSLKELAVLSTVANAPIVTQTGGAMTLGGGVSNGSNCNALAVIGHRTRMVELGCDGKAMEQLLPKTCSVVRGSDPVISKLTQAVVADDGSTQSFAKNIQHQDQQDAHPDIELDLAPAKLCPQSGSDVEAATEESQFQLEVDELHREEAMNASINTAVVDKEAAAVDSIECAESVRTETGTGVLNTDTTLDVVSTANGHGSQDFNNSSDLSIASSTNVTQPVSGSHRTIDPYSVALDDALGSSSFNVNAVSTNVGTYSVCTDLDHTDAESVTGDGKSLVSSPRESNLEIVSSLSDVEVATSDQIKETLPGHRVVKAEIIKGDPALVPAFPINQPSSDEAKVESVPGCGLPLDEMNSSGAIAYKEKEAVEKDLGSAAGEPAEVLIDQKGSAPGHATAIQPGEKDQSADNKSKTGQDTVTTHVSMASKPTGGIIDASHDICKAGSTVAVAALPNSPAQKADELREKVEQENKPSVSSAVVGSAAAQTEKKLSMSGSISSLTSIPEVALADPGDECDGSRLTDGGTSSNHQGTVAVTMAPPGSSVVMRKKPGVRLAPLPLVKVSLWTDISLSHSHSLSYSHSYSHSPTTLNPHSDPPPSPSPIPSPSHSPSTLPSLFTTGLSL